jgi:hypothetical protein
LDLFQRAAAVVEKRSYRYESAGDIIGNLSRCYERMGRFAEAEVWRRKWLAAIEERDGSDSAARAGALLELGANLLEQKKYADAAPILHDSLTLLKKWQPDGWAAFHAQSLLGGALAGQRAFADAEPRLLAGYEGLKAREHDISAHNRFRVHEALARVVQLYDAWGKPEKAAFWRKRTNDFQVLSDPTRAR